MWFERPAETTCATCGNSIPCGHSQPGSIMLSPVMDFSGLFHEDGYVEFDPSMIAACRRARLAVEVKDADTPHPEAISRVVGARPEKVSEDARALVRDLPPAHRTVADRLIHALEEALKQAVKALEERDELRSKLKDVFEATGHECGRWPDD